MDSAASEEGAIDSVKGKRHRRASPWVQVLAIDGLNDRTFSISAKRAVKKKEKKTKRNGKHLKS